jgi:hypothetical protein
MTIASQLTSQQSACNGATSQFNFNNKIFSATDLIVTLIDTYGNLYSFSNGGSGNVFSNSATGLSYTVYNIDTDTGCYIVFSSAPALNWTCDMRTQVAELQSTSVKNQGAFLPELHEEFFDRATRMIQDLYRLAYTYGIHGNDIEATPWPSVGTPAQRAGQLLGFNSAGVLSLLQYTLSGVTTGALLNNLTALRALTPKSGGVTAVILMGNASPGDGGGGIYYYVSADTTSADNGGTIIVSADGSRWYSAVLWR